ncbi:MAG TPA: TetR/AcrR family transcriptional regulator [Anaerolineales bacterium]|nr:TetR/AcrR family transcriptional regulator [Anaerolineales bacterium]HRF48763.1 TetR/AcrR family transcriptional regulator [Anaerolineales bacterium]
MPRVVNEEENALKRAEILDAAQSLIYVKGYEQMSIQDILDELQISKGAFYHYYDSKPSLLEALIDRMLEQVMRLVLPIIQDPHEPALSKIQKFFTSVGTWKTARKDFLMGFVRSWYSDKNALLRQKMTARMLHVSGPWLAAIVRQGIDEGVFDTPYPDQIGAVTFGMVQSLGELIGDWALAPQPAPVQAKRIVDTIAAYNHVLERLLGAPSGSIVMMQPDVIEAWFGISAKDPPGESNVAESTGESQRGV